MAIYAPDQFFLSERGFRKLLKELPTPFYLYDRSGICAEAAALQAAFSWNDGFRQYFPARLNPTPGLLRLLRETDCYVLKHIRYFMNRNQLCKVLSPKSSKTEQIALFRCA